MAIQRPPPAPLDVQELIGSAWQQWFSRLPDSINKTSATMAISQEASGIPWANFGAIVNRLNDRVLIAEATVNDAAQPNVAKDWLSTFQVAAGMTLGSVATTQASVLSGETSGTLPGAWLAGAQSLGALTLTDQAKAGQFYALNSHLTLATKAWAVYAEAHKTVTTTGTTTVAEFSTRTLFAAGSSTPYTAGNVTGLTLSSGCGLAAAGQFDASVGIQFLANPKKFGVGINFAATALTGTDGTGTGSATAIAMAQGHMLSWYNSSGSMTASLFGNVTTTAKATRLLFDDTGFNVLDASNALMAVFPYVATPVNYLSLLSAAAAGTVQVSALGTDANIPLKVDSKGTGQVILGHTGMRVRFVTYVAGAPAATGYIIIEDYSGTQYKLLTAT